MTGLPINLPNGFQAPQISQSAPQLPTVPTVPNIMVNTPIPFATPNIAAGVPQLNEGALKVSDINLDIDRNIKGFSDEVISLQKEGAKTVPETTQNATGNSKIISSDEQITLWIDKSGKLTDEKAYVDVALVKGKYILDNEDRITSVHNKYISKNFFYNENNELIYNEKTYNETGELLSREYLKDGVFSVPLENSVPYDLQVKNLDTFRISNDVGYGIQKMSRCRGLSVKLDAIILLKNGNAIFIAEEQDNGNYKVLFKNGGMQILTDVPASEKDEIMNTVVAKDTTTIKCNEETNIHFDKFGKITNDDKSLSSDIIKNGSYTLDNQGRIKSSQEDSASNFTKYVYNNENDQLDHRELIDKKTGQLQAIQYFGERNVPIHFEKSFPYNLEVEYGSTFEFDRIGNGIQKISGKAKNGEVVVLRQNGNALFIAEKLNNGNYNVIVSNNGLPQRWTNLSEATKDKVMEKISGITSNPTDKTTSNSVSTQNAKTKKQFSHMFLKEPLSLTQAQISILENFNKQQQWVLFARGGKTIESLSPAQLSILEDFDKQKLLLLFDYCDAQTIIQLTPQELTQLSVMNSQQLYLHLTK